MARPATLPAAALVLLATLAGALTRARAYEQRVFNGTDACSGTPAPYWGVSGECVPVDNSTSYRITCDDLAANANWTYESFSDAACAGVLAGETLMEQGAASCAASSGGFSMEVDCGRPAEVGCFSAASEVELEDGTRVPIAAVREGDRVLSVSDDGALVYDTVFRVTHADEAAAAEHVRLTTHSGRVLELTPDHLLHVGDLSLVALTPAAKVAPGQFVFVVTPSQEPGGQGHLSVNTVATVEHVRATGLYNVHTLGGRIVVNGVVATHFTGQSSWGAWNNAAPYWYQAVYLLQRLAALRA